MGCELRASGIRFSYDSREILRGVEMRLGAGELVALLGPNGSGKSTLIKVLLGHLSPGEGMIDWDARPVRQWRRRELARRVAYLPQSPAYEPDQRLVDVIRMGRAPYWGAFGLESARDELIVAQVAQSLGLGDLLERRMDEISGGQRQTVFIGRCLAQEPAALLLDEPSTFLDLRHQVDLCRLLRKLAKERGIGVLMASHDLNLAGAFADRCLLLHEGVILADGTPETVLNCDLLGRVYGLAMRRISSPDQRPYVAPIVES